jgi:hypothetical protein
MAEDCVDCLEAPTPRSDDLLDLEDLWRLAPLRHGNKVVDNSRDLNAQNAHCPDFRTDKFILVVKLGEGGRGVLLVRGGGRTCDLALNEDIWETRQKLNGRVRMRIIVLPPRSPRHTITPQFYQLQLVQSYSPEQQQHHPLQFNASNDSSLATKKSWLHLPLPQHLCYSKYFPPRGANVY